MTEPTPATDAQATALLTPALLGKVKVAFSAVMLVGSAVFTWQMVREQDRIHRRLDIRDAYFNKGLIDGAKAREKAYFEIRRQHEQIVLFCKKQQCELPTELEVLPAEPQFESLETILTRNKE